MRTAGGLFAAIVRPENFHRAWRRARRGKRDRPEVAEYAHDLASNLELLRATVEAGTWRAGTARTFWISDPKRRLISAAPFSDRVVHHAVMDVLEPVVERRLVADTYACRPGRGVHAALGRILAFARRHSYVLQTDVMRYFPSIDHHVLKRLFRRLFRESRLLALLDGIVDDAGPQPDALAWFPGDDLFTPTLRRRGLPIGNLSSQHFANWYLDPVDHFVRETLRLPGYARYMDDLYLFADSRAELRSARGALEQRMDALRLRLHPAKTKIVPTRAGFNALGARVTLRGLRLSAASRNRQGRRLRFLGREVAVGGRTMAQAGLSIQAMVAHARWLGGERLWDGWLRRTTFRLPPAVGSCARSLPGDRRVGPIR